MSAAEKLVRKSRPEESIIETAPLPKREGVVRSGYDKFDPGFMVETLTRTALMKAERFRAGIHGEHMADSMKFMSNMFIAQQMVFDVFFRPYLSISPAKNNATEEKKFLD